MLNANPQEYEPDQLFWAAFFSCLASFLALPLIVTTAIVSFSIVPGFIVLEILGWMRTKAASATPSIPPFTAVFGAQGKHHSPTNSLTTYWSPQCAAAWDNLPSASTERLMREPVNIMQRAFLMWGVCMGLSLYTQLVLNSDTVLWLQKSRIQEEQRAMEESGAAGHRPVVGSHNEKLELEQCCHVAAPTWRNAVSHAFSNTSWLRYLFQPITLGSKAQAWETAFFLFAEQLQVTKITPIAVSAPVMLYNLYM
jgi:hypothetical protein